MGLPGLQMGDLPPLEGDGERQIRESEHLRLLRGLFPCLPMIKMAAPNLGILVPFLAALQI